MQRRVVLHVGLHKSGTTFLQNVWAANRARLAEQGVHYPGGPGEPIQRMASYDLLGRRPRGVDDQRVPGQWTALRETARTSPHATVLISDEGLIFGTARHATTAVDSFSDHEVHVLITCRDLGRVLPSAWQEEVKNDRTWTWSEFIDAVQDPERRATNPARGFWRAQDLPAILATWGGAVPAERVHVVTVPPPGARPSVLLERVGEVVGYDADLLTDPPRWDNSSLGTAGTEVVRRLNENLDKQLNQRQHAYVVKQVLVPHIVRETDDHPYGLPAEQVAWVAAEAQRHIEAIRDGGYSVTGDLDDLLPRPDAGRRRPDEFDTEELLAAALVALAGVSRRHALMWWRRRKDDTTVVEPDSAAVRWGSAVRSASFRARRAGADLADRNALAASALSRYLRLTGQDRGARGADD